LKKKLPHHHHRAITPHVDLSHFDGSNSKLWQRRCEEYFHRWDTPSSCWISYASSQFVGAAATWLEAFLTKCPQATWAEFVQAVQAHFMRNQYQVLLRRMYRISQTSTVEEYVQQFSDLVDQISAYEAHPNQLNNLTRFLDGLRLGVRVLVAIQQPEDLDTAYTMALLYEELGDGCTPWNSQFSPVMTARRSYSASNTALPALPPPPPPATWVSKTVEEKKESDPGRYSVNDKCNSLRAYRKPKGLCFICDERWGRDHQCKQNIQLHIVQEMLD
jgi:hypothetical protein